MPSILEVRNLGVSYHSRNGSRCRALGGVDFSLRSGEILGVLGESGSGKSTLAASLLRLLPANAQITSGSVLLDGQDVLRATPQELQQLRGRRISLIFQEPSLALHPTMRVHDQIIEVLRAHHTPDKNAQGQRTSEVLHALFPGDADRIASSYPHQLSGGQRQRVLIAQAIACRPSILIADEPTASLDPTTQRDILSLLAKLRDKLGISIIFITHYPALLLDIADRTLVLYAGKVAEIGSVNDVLVSPRHPYTSALLGCMPSREEHGIPGHKTPLPVIPGSPPSLALLPQGCAFEPRCADRMHICQASEPASFALSGTHAVSCFKFAS